jgi:hypothetical protein
MEKTTSDVLRVFQRPMTRDCEWLVVASDGLYHLIDNKDVIKNVSGKLTAEEVVHCVRLCASHGTHTPTKPTPSARRQAASTLFQDISGNPRSAIKGHDNCTILVLKLTHHSVPKSLADHFKKPQ